MFNKTKYCKECFEHIRPSCMLTNGICVFCYYNTDTWENNGEIIKKEDALYETGAGKPTAKSDID